MRLEVIDTFGGLEQIRGEWAAFERTVEGRTPFQSPEWLLTWWRHFGSGELQMLVFRAECAMAGVVPLFRHEWQGRRQLTLMGSGISDYLEPAIAPEHRNEVIERLRRYLVESDDWDICDWQDMGRAAIAGLAAEAGSALTGIGRLQEDTPCSEIRLSGEFEEYWAHRSKDLRRNLKRYGQRAEETGPIEFGVTCRADGGLIDELIRLHGDRWGKQGQPGMVAANRSGEVLREVAGEFERRGLLRIFALRLRGAVVAISIGFWDGVKLYSYLSAFDPRFEILGFGRRLLYESLRHAYEQRYSAWNFCRGEEAYKFSFGAERIAKYRLTLRRADLGI